MSWIWPPHRIPVANEGLGWDPLITKNAIILVTDTGRGNIQDMSNISVVCSNYDYLR